MNETVDIMTQDEKDVLKRKMLKADVNLQLFTDDKQRAIAFKHKVWSNTVLKLGTLLIATLSSLSIWIVVFQSYVLTA